MNTPDERATLAAVEHYDRRARTLSAAMLTEPWNIPSGTGGAMLLIARARAAELRDPEPSPYTVR